MYSVHYPVSFLTSLPKTESWKEQLRPKCMMDFVKGNGCQERPGNSFAAVFSPQLWFKGHSGYQKKWVWCELGGGVGRFCFPGLCSVLNNTRVSRSPA